MILITRKQLHKEIGRLRARLLEARAERDELERLYKLLRKELKRG